MNPPGPLDLATLRTEMRNELTAGMDGMPVAELLSVMNAADCDVPVAVAAAIGQIAAAVEQVSIALRRGGRLVYLGAGTSGRIGLLDAVECPPTFGIDPSRVIALLAGGSDAFGVAAEGAEDSPADGVRDVEAAGVGAGDVLVGLSASGRTPYVIAALDRAGELGAVTVSVSCNRGALASGHADIAIEVDTGPEVLTGSTRLKAGTAQKLVCNMLTTAAMVRLGKTFANLMIDLRPTNEKLFDRARRIVAEAAGVDLETAGTALESAGNRCKVATVMLLAGLDVAEAERRLASASGFVARAIDDRPVG